MLYRDLGLTTTAPGTDGIDDLAAESFVDGRKPTEPMLNQVEAAIRAYAPCLSCTAHAAGQMPLIVEILGPNGEILGSIGRTP
ncbi:MAG TPA: hypothetical protein VGM37_20965 [Armatimonadota bacterium]|jgi:NAD-reducing hydrogenase large subunit